MQYTMKEVQERTGLSRKAIRYYMQENLIQIEKVDKHYIFSENMMHILQCIHYYRELGVDLSTIKSLLNEDDQETIVKLLEYSYMQLANKKADKEKELACISRTLDNTFVSRESYDTMDDILFLNDNNIVLEPVMIPFRRNGSYYQIEEVEFTRLESKLFHLLLRLGIILIAIILVVIITLEVSGVHL